MTHKRKNCSPNHEDHFSSKTTKQTKLNDSTNYLKKASINLNINSFSDTNSDYIDNDYFEEEQEFKDTFVRHGNIAF